MSSTKWGIVSTGLISGDFVNSIFSLNNSTDHQVVAVAARNLKSAQEFADKFDIPKAYEGYDALAKDPNVEVVYVGSINPTHLNICKLLLNNGKHVLCEKPLGMNVKETEEMVNLAREKKLFFMEAIWSRVQPSYLKLKEEMLSGAIGEVFDVNSQFGVQIEADRVAKKELGGGALLDIGIYCVQFSQFIFEGEMPFEIVARGHLNSNGVDQSISATMLYKNNRTASFQISSKVNNSCEANVFGTKGSMKLCKPFWCADRLELKSGDILEFPYSQKGKVDFHYPNSAGLGFEAQHVRECLLNGLTESPKLSLEETLTIAKIMECIRKQVGVVYDQD